MNLRIGVAVLSLVKVASIVLVIGWKKIGFYGYLFAGISIAIITAQSFGYLTAGLQFVFSFSILVIALFITNEYGDTAWNLLDQKN